MWYDHNKSCVCEACAAHKNSAAITKAHIVGKICKYHNQCSICTRISVIRYMLKHFAKSCSHKCVFCTNSNHISFKSGRSLIKRLYMVHFSKSEYKLPIGYLGI